MSDVDINAYKLELEEAVREAVTGIGNLETKVRALVVKYESLLAPPPEAVVSPAEAEPYQAPVAPATEPVPETPPKAAPSK